MRFIKYGLVLTTIIVTNALADDIEKSYFSNKKLTLNRQETAALALSKAWTNSKMAVKPVLGVNGGIRFIYGTEYISIVCAPLQICDVELQRGEVVNAVNLGDISYWSVEPAVSGDKLHRIEHLIIKPKDVGLNTSLVVTTNKRTYHFRLRSTRNNYMHHVSFIYPEVAAAKWKALAARSIKNIEKKTIPTTGEYLNDLSFDYRITGTAPWKPVRVYNDGRKTIIEMPDNITSSEAPTLLEIRDNSGWFTSDKQVLVNYRLQGKRYVVDSVFNKAVLIAGVGSEQKKITIERQL